MIVSEDASKTPINVGISAVIQPLLDHNKENRPLLLISKEVNKTPITIGILAIAQSIPAISDDTNNCAGKDLVPNSVGQVEKYPVNAQKKLDLNQSIEDPPKWKNLFVGNKLASRGMSLNFMAPIIQNDEKIVELSKLEQEKET